MSHGRQDPLFSLEVPYQIVVVGAAVSALLLVVLAPRVPGDSPQVFGYTVIVHGVALTAVALFGARYTAQEAMPALVGWSVLLAAPEVWAFALVSPLGFAFQPFLTLTLYALAVQSAAHWNRLAGWGGLALGMASLLGPAPLNLGAQAVGLGAPTWAFASLLVLALGWRRGRRS